MAPALAPLPVAPDRAVLSNRIALVLSRQAALAKTLLGRAPDSPAVGGRGSDADADADADDFAADPNAGPGYMPEKHPSAARAQDRLLRGRLRLGVKRRAPGGGGSGDGAEDEDEEQGRSALGRRKRPRRELDPDTAAHADAPGRADPIPDTDPDPPAVPKQASPDDAVDDDASQSQTPGPAVEAPVDGSDHGSRHDAGRLRTKKRRKNKNGPKKRKNKGPP